MLLILGIVVILICVLALSLNQKERSVLSGCADDYFQNVNIRRQINESHDLNFQKEKAAEIYRKSKIPLGHNGYLVGIICSGFYVLKNLEGELFSICSSCVKKTLNQKGGDNFNAFYDLDVMRQSLTVVEMKPGTGRGYDFVKPPFTGKKPICEMESCIKQDS
jgi:hypothetical protein